MRDDMLPWFAVRVKSRHEKSVAHLFTQKELESFVPLYRAKQRWADRVKQLDLPLFPNYVFCRMDPNVRLPVLTTPGVLGIVGGRSSQATVDEDEIASIQKVTAAHLSCEPFAWIAAGARVKIDHGPLTGVSGIVVNIKGADRLVLSVTLLQRSVLVEIDRHSAAPMHTTPLLNRPDITYGRG